MKQLVQNLRTGETALWDIPIPRVSKGHILIKTSMSLISSGTERMLREFGKATLLKKAMQQPEKLQLVIDKIRNNGLVSTIKLIHNQLDTPIKLGYCNVGVVIEIGEGVEGFQIGDRVANNGSHAEIVSVPQNLVVKLPSKVSDEEATFIVPGSISLHAVRLLNMNIGETVAVIGLGLMGLLVADLLQINGCKVIGTDTVEARRMIATQRGVTTFDASSIDPEVFAKEITEGYGVDGVIIAASAPRDDLIGMAAKMCRRKGAIVLLGMSSPTINRSLFYEKELRLEVSRSYGAGRYDDQYEIHNMDYPYSYVRWTENRNFKAVLGLIESGKLNVKSLIDKVIPFSASANIYEDFSARRGIGILFKYPQTVSFKTKLYTGERHFNPGSVTIGIIGGGNYVRNTLLPMLNRKDVKYIASANGLNGTALARQHRIPFSTTNYHDILSDPAVSLVIIATRHHLHAQMLVDALESGKNVWMEKPLTIYPEELKMIEEALGRHPIGSFTIGFNRRFSLYILKMKSLLGDSPMNVIMTMNAGDVSKNSWLQDREIGGGRIIGEACHLFDLAVYLTNSLIQAVCMQCLGDSSETTDNATILLRMKNGSIVTIHYFSNGSRAYRKERIEIFSAQRVLILDDYRSLAGYGFRNFSKMKSGHDKGHQTFLDTMIKAVEEGSGSIIPMHEMINVTAATFQALESLKRKCWVDIL